MPAKRGDRVTPPTKPGNWEVRHATADAAKGWEELCRTARSAMWDAWVVLSERPTTPVNRARQHPLRGTLSTREVHKMILDQWQYEVTGSARIWYCPDMDNQTVWVVDVHTRHPKQTE